MCITLYTLQRNQDLRSSNCINSSNLIHIFAKITDCRSPPIFGPSRNRSRITLRAEAKLCSTQIIESKTEHLTRARLLMRARGACAPPRKGNNNTGAYLRIWRSWTCNGGPEAVGRWGLFETFSSTSAQVKTPSGN